MFGTIVTSGMSIMLSLQSAKRQMKQARELREASENRDALPAVKCDTCGSWHLPDVGCDCGAS